MSTRKRTSAVIKVDHNEHELCPWSYIDAPEAIKHLADRPQRVAVLLERLRILTLSFRPTIPD